MTHLGRPLGWFLGPVVLSAVAVCGLIAAEPEQAKTPVGSPPAKQGPGGIIVSREITFLTGPLRKDGSGDYLAAINERASQGVTPTRP